MKKILLLIAALFSTSMMAQTQMHINMKDGSTIEYNIDDINTITFDVIEHGDPTTEGHEYVDLGLPSGLKWAKCNVGATKPEEFGDYFAWGETEPKSYYEWDSYKWCEGPYLWLTKYCGTSEYGIVDNKTVLDLEDDAAHVNWGGSWRMPTTEEQDELRENCSWIWTTHNGVEGYEVIGPNSNSIFLPAANCIYGYELYDPGSGYYWSSTLGANQAGGVYCISFASFGYGWSDEGRFAGLSVRPVCQM